MNFAALSLARALGAPAPADLAHEILRELVEIDTSDSRGDNPTAARAMARRLESFHEGREFLYRLVKAPRPDHAPRRRVGSAAPAL